MPRRPLTLTTSAAPLAPVFAAIRDRLDVPGPFPAAALSDAAAAAADPPRPETDLRDLPLVTIDPPASRDLDQALHLARRGAGFRVHYAIADVGGFVRPGSALDAEVRRRGVTHYGPDHRSPLHPDVLGEDAASLLPGRDRPAVVWRLDLDAAGVLLATGVRRAMVCSRARLAYGEVQAELDAGTAGEMLSLVPLVGAARREVERVRGGIALPIPEQEIEREGDHYRLAFRRPLPVEEDNAQLSLLTGIAAAGVMRSGRIGIQRTLPPADDRALRRLRTAARALGLAWPDDLSLPDVVRGLDPSVATHAAFLDEATVAFRGAGYRAFDGFRPADARHAGIAANYAHVTAPLRRLVDRWGLACCVALDAGIEVPDWARSSLYQLPDLMADATRRAGAYERATIDVVEAALLSDRVGDTFAAVVVEVDEEGDDAGTRGLVLIPEPAVRARVHGTDLEPGTEITVRVAEADVAAGRVVLERA